MNRRGTHVAHPDPSADLPETVDWERAEAVAVFRGIYTSLRLAVYFYAAVGVFVASIVWAVTR